jgi:uncharacterized protein
MSTKPRYRDITVERNVPFRLADGTTLLSDLYRPSTPGRYPALILRLPYNKNAAQAYTYLHPIWYARHGYLVIIQDSRGRWHSEGNFYPLRDEARDGYETVEWAASLPSCNGAVGLYGFSYVGLSQMLTAAEQPPSLKALAPAFTGSGQYENWAYSGGAFCLGLNAWWTVLLAIDTARRHGLPDLEARLAEAVRLMPSRFWTLPLADVLPLPELRELAPYYLDWVAHPTPDTYWQTTDLERRYERITAPALHIGGWYDSFFEGTLRNYAGLTRLAAGPDRRNQRLVVGPWHHNPWTRLVGTVDFGPEATSWLDDLQVRWFDHWLRGEDTGLLDEPPVKVFVMGANRWREADEWPLPGTEYQDFYLHSGGRANSLNGNGWLDREEPKDEWPDVYIYDPRDPVLSLGGRSCCIPEISPMGPADQRPAEIRNELLIYTTEPLEEDLEVTGPVVAELWASSSATDTDFTVKLVDVFPDGRSINLCDGIIRARYRDSLTAPELLVPGEAYRYVVQVGATSNLFRQGHCIRVHVSSSNFPLYDRNPNTGQWPKDARYGDLEVATQFLFHDFHRPSRLRLPVIRR